MQSTETNQDIRNETEFAGQGESANNCPAGGDHELEWHDHEVRGTEVVYIYRCTKCGALIES